MTSRAPPTTGPPSSLQPAAADEEEIDCSICLAAAPVLNTALRTTQCGHTFCEGCLCLYASKRPAGALVPCPVCRTPLTDESLPRTFTLTLHNAAGAGLGITLAAAREARVAAGSVADVVGVAPGSIADVAGLRVGMWILDIDGEPIARGESAAGVCARLGRTGPVAAFRVGWARAPAAPAARAPVPVAANVFDAQRRYNFGSLACCCCCTVTAQVWTRALRLRAWTCYATAAVLWLLWVGQFVAEEPFSGWISMGLADGVSNGTGLGWRVGGIRGPPRDFDLDDGITRGEWAYLLYATVSVPLCLCCWLVGGTMLKMARDRLVRDEPAVWARATGGMAEREGELGTFHPWCGPFGSCFCLAHALIGALVADAETPEHDAEYSLLLPLHVPSRVRLTTPAGAAGAADAGANQGEVALVAGFASGIRYPPDIRREAV